MNPATTVRPDVATFIETLRDHLSDLTEEEREELVGGLEADLSEQAAEGVLTLPDPAAYAAELRAAAGLPARTRRARVKMARPPLRIELASAVDACRARWLELAAHDDHTRRGWAMLEAIRPAWWVARAWVAVTLLDILAGAYENVTILPSLGVPLLGPAVLVLAIVVSTLIGQGRLWPGSGPDRPLASRLLLAGLNVFAVVVPLTFHFAGSQAYVDAGPAYAHASPVPDRNGHPLLRSGRDVVRNIYAYDAQGQPLRGVQLFDQRGRPIAVAPESSMGERKQRQVTCPWFNGATPLYNVFPLPERLQPRGTCLGEVDPAKVGAQGFHAPPLASVPPVASPVQPDGGVTAVAPQG